MTAPKQIVSGVLLVLCCLLPLQLTAQQPAVRQPTRHSSDEVFFPFISSLRVAIRDAQVRLSWRDVPNYQGNYLIYRHTEPITETNLHRAVRAGSVAPGTERFTDTPPQTGEYYYAVLTEQEDGQPLAVFIPFRNQTLRPIAIQRTGPPPAAVASLSVRTDQDRVMITFEPTDPDRRLAVLRSSEPIRSAGDAAAATLLEIIEGSRNSYIDTPPAGVPYYYGVFDADLIGTDSLSIQPGVNTSQESVALTLPEAVPVEAEPAAAPEITAEEPGMPEIPELAEPDPYLPLPGTPRLTDRPEARSNPLPLLQSRFAVLQHARLDSFPIVLPGRQSVSVETLDAVEAIRRRYDTALPSHRPEPVRLGDEHTLPHSASRLEQIIETSFAEQNWHQAYTSLTDLLDSATSQDVERQARFYRGQTLLFLDRPHEAVLELLMVRDVYYVESRPLIDAALRSAGKL
ncbi:hypothetical protein [Spirochaeta africana]|uniref:Fibronectin type-III domain-containing protein n=1 Tax=Spirochaeta africana (strain ATCC 700263 / DSM 8902 / Z-7692) TaxID=889378 RepID=H9UHZ8_SPIAZ|nr:hypothetical protein [Spirochaeta africana]AFG37141.1 hypothetical protein Spiaf_1054 [Spirochaeta africana DSM 8902]